MPMELRAEICATSGASISRYSDIDACALLHTLSVIGISEHACCVKPSCREVRHMYCMTWIQIHDEKQ